ncbi:MAG TPA: hypothetical protein VLE49_19935 [Anaerolineales bacterium]|nr:hypothetical protein [Anaerolineales bacterium]
MSDSKQTNPTPDDLLADFTDRVLDGKASVPASPADAELRGLEETVLRLKQVLPQEAVEEKTLRRMQTNFRARVQKADSPTIPAWQFARPRQRLVLTFAAVALAILLVALPLLPFTNEPMQGTAGTQARDAVLLAGAACVIVLLFWARRHK